MEMTMTMTNHIGPCVLACFRYLGVPAPRWTYNARTGENVWPAALRRNGYAVRSRRSAYSAKTVGALRAQVAKKGVISAPPGAVLIVRVKGHVLLMGADGRTIVDTDPRVRDRRAVRGICAVWRR